MSLRFTLHDSSKKKSDWAVKPVWFGSSPSCEKELPRRSRVFTKQESRTTLWSGSFRAISRLCMLSGGIFGACLPALGRFDFLLLCARVCLVLFAASLPAHCGLLVSCRFVLLPARWLGFLRLACPCVVVRSFRAGFLLASAGSSVLPLACPYLARSRWFRAASWFYLLGGSLFAAYLPVLCGLAGFPPLRACTCFVAVLALACL